jgi:hypothetical protein
MRCLCTACMLEAAVNLLRSGRVSMGTLLVEMALQRERAEHQRPVKAPARTRKARARL